MNTRFDWSLVRSFLAALDHGSLLGAARALGSSQPTLGRHIAQLEGELGCVLFERTGRGLVPTARALELARAARAMEQGADDLSRAAAGGSEADAGAVRISASQPVACYLLPPVLARMRMALPRVRVELVASNAVSNLLKREADIALRMVQPQQASLIARRVARITLGACAHQDYLRRRGTPRAAAELAQHDIVAGDRGKDVERGFAAQGLVIPDTAYVLRTDDLVAGWQAVRAGLGIGFVADYVRASDPAVLPVLPALRIPPLPLWLVVHREIRTNRTIRSVYDFLAQDIARAL